ncbi:MAG: hypothetical protein V1659_04550 [Candidatus Woesearchaeota archaeon]
MNIKPGKYTSETFAEKNNLSPQSALNLLSKLKKQGFVHTSGGGRQKRIYTITKTPKTEPNGFFHMINRYSPEKIVPYFDHYVHGKYAVEQAIIDGLRLQKENKDARIRSAMLHLFRHITSWKRLFELAKKNSIEDDIRRLYAEARSKTKCRKMPARYER